MICLRCGYCCIQLEVIIVNNPDLGPIYENLISKHTGDRCPHLLGDEPGKYSCAVHDRPWYKHTPCAEYSQIEHSKDAPCRMGVFVLEHNLRY